MKHELPDQVDAIIEAWDSGEPEPEPARILRVADVPSIFDFEESVIEWAVTRFIAMSAVTMIASDAGLLKSTLLTSAGRAVTEGADFAGMSTSRREVVILRILRARWSRDGSVLPAFDKERPGRVPAQSPRYREATKIRRLDTRIRDEKVTQLLRNGLDGPGGFI